MSKALTWGEPGKAGSMSRAEVQAFLSEPLIIRVATYGPRGYPYVFPSWYEFDGQDFWLVGRARSAWVQYLLRDRRVGFTVDDEWGAALRRVLGEGDAEIVEGPCREGRWVEVTKRMICRYEAAKYVKVSLEQPRYLVRIRPTRLTSWQGGAWHPRYVVPAGKEA